MNIILIHIGNILPNYFYSCINQIRKYYNDNIYVIFNNNLKDENINKYNLIHIPLEDFINIPRLQEFEFFSFIKDYGEFWNFAFKRLFILEEVIKQYNLSNILHMENDILIYHNPSEIKFNIIYKDKIAVNLIGEKYATYAYCFIPHYDSLYQVNNENIKILKEGKGILLNRYKEGMVNEMLILHELFQKEIVDILPMLPEGISSKNLEYFNLLFDGASFGQYIGGTHNCDNIGFFTSQHYAGELFKNKKYNIIWNTNLKGFKEPYLIRIQDNKYFKLANLHIHSKKLEQWI